MTRDYRGHEPESGVTNNFWQFGGGGHGQGGWRILSFLLVGVLALALGIQAFNRWSDANAKQPAGDQRVTPGEEPSRLEKGKADPPRSNGPDETGLEQPPKSDAPDEDEQPGTPDTSSDGSDSAAPPSDGLPQRGTRRSDAPPTEESRIAAEESAATKTGADDGALMREALKLGLRTARHPSLSRGTGKPIQD